MYVGERIGVHLATMPSLNYHSNCSSTLLTIGRNAGAETSPAAAKRENGIKVMKCPPSAAVKLLLISLDHSDGE
jgi:hypothetical protein